MSRQHELLHIEQSVTQTKVELSVTYTSKRKPVKQINSLTVNLQKKHGDL